MFLYLECEKLLYQSLMNPQKRKKFKLDLFQVFMDIECKNCCSMVSDEPTLETKREARNIASISIPKMRKILSHNLLRIHTRDKKN